jgi:hypothetical protein
MLLRKARVLFLVGQNRRVAELGLELLKGFDDLFQFVVHGGVSVFLVSRIALGTRKGMRKARRHSPELVSVFRIRLIRRQMRVRKRQLRLSPVEVHETAPS